MQAKAHFLEMAAEKTANPVHAKTIAFNMARYEAGMEKGRPLMGALNLARTKSKYIKWKVLENLDRELVRFEQAFKKNGGEVYWARDTKQAQKIILDLLKGVNAKKVVKGKSMTTEEIHLNEFLEGHEIQAVETDLGEYIVQLGGEKPYHIVTPAMHKSRQDVAQLFHEKLGTPPEAEPQELTLKARALLRDSFLTAEAGITGANFLISETGTVALTENEGNIRMSATYPKLHIVLAGIEKILPNLEDLDLFWPLLSYHGTGQFMTNYNTLFSGPSKEGHRMVVVLLDNGRSSLLNLKELRSALSCIRCGACLNVCPVYRAVGGHTYETVYSGPIGSVISPHLNGMNQYGHLSQASSLCGRCTEICPVGIPLHEHLLRNRHLEGQMGSRDWKAQLGWKAWAWAMTHPSWAHLMGSSIKNKFMTRFFSTWWGAERELPQVAPQSFLSWYRQKKTVKTKN